MGLFKTISDMFTGAGAVQSNQVSRNPHTQLVRTKTAELEYKRELLKEKNHQRALDLIAEENMLIANRERQITVQEETRGKFENFVYYDLTVQEKTKVIIDYYFSANTDNWKLLVFCCKDSLPLDADDLLKKYDRGTVRLIERRIIATDLQNEISSGNPDKRLNGRLFGTVIDEPLTQSGKQVYYYCVMLQTETEKLMYLDGKQAILEQYNRQDVETFKQKKITAKAKTHEVIDAYEKAFNKKQMTIYDEFEDELKEITERGVQDKIAVEALRMRHVQKIEKNNLIDEEEKEDLIDLVEDKTAQFLAR